MSPRPQRGPEDSVRIKKAEIDLPKGDIRQGEHPWLVAQRHSTIMDHGNDSTETSQDTIYSCFYFELFVTQGHDMENHCPEDSANLLLYHGAGITSSYLIMSSHLIT